MAQLLTIVACILASVAVASAECAWVLWENNQLAGNRQEWRVLGGFSSEPACVATGRARANTGDLYIGTEDDFGGRTTFFCLPDTIDPRGPKAK